MMIEVNFQHWQYSFKEEDWQYGSPNKKSVAKQKLCTALEEADLVFETNSPILFEEDLIFCANEAFPEAAIADPLADIEVWNQWRSGVRIFPYPGKYAKLSISHQLPKTSSPSSVGVIGEIMAGLFGQALVGHDVLVRVIREWPDFIFYPVDGRYGFLEAKGFTPKLESFLHPVLKVPKNELGECLVNAVHQLAIDPEVKMWYSFTEITQVQPEMRFSVKFLELEAPLQKRDEYRRQRGDKLLIPAPVIDGLAERAIQAALYDLRREMKNFTQKSNNRLRQKNQEELIRLSLEKFRNTWKSWNKELIDINEFSFNKIEQSIKEQILRFKFNIFENEVTLTLFEKHQQLNIFDNIENYNAKYRIKCVRKTLGKVLYIVNFEDSIYLDRYIWKPNAELANEAYKIINSYKIWRCGSSLFFLCYDGVKIPAAIYEWLDELVNPSIQF